MSIAACIDHTLLKPTASAEEIDALCREAKAYGFAAVCVPPPFVRRAAGLLADSKTKIATVIGFPFGYSTAKAKLAETLQAIEDGADELDAVINLIALKNSDWDYLAEEIALLIPVIRREGRILKVIIESGVLTDEEIIRCCEIYAKAGVDFLKTSTGYAQKGASAEHVQLLRRHLPSAIKIKASGGIRDYAFARQLLAAGADRLGCSAGVTIVKQQIENNE
ncbi:MAG TPA: deoxyribose-phosphate aldolase [Flavitalea sp.]|nr:deoxyribose-phosphate aldolase [Flavitalea sp.]